MKNLMLRLSDRLLKDRGNVTQGVVWGQSLALIPAVKFRPKPLFDWAISRRCTIYMISIRSKKI
jgi:hypothetical protein